MASTTSRLRLAALAGVALLAVGCSSTSHGHAAPSANAGSSGSAGSRSGSGHGGAGAVPSSGPGSGRTGAGTAPVASNAGVDYRALSASLTAHGVHLTDETQIAVTPAIQVGPFLTAYAMRTANLTAGSVWFGAWHDHAGMTAMVGLAQGGSTSPHVDDIWTVGDWMVMLQASTPQLAASFEIGLKAVGATRVFP